MALSLAGVHRAQELVARQWRAATAAGLVVAAAASSTVLWEVLVEPGPPSMKGPLLRTISSEVRRLPAVLRQGIGKFGFLDTPMPAAAYAAWAAVIGLVVVAAFVAADRRERVVLMATVGGAVVVSLVVGVRAAVDGPGRSYLQARWVLGVGVLVPLLCGEIVFRHASETAAVARRLLWLAAGVAAVVHVAAWLANARRHAVGIHGPLLFMSHSAWSPPLGWWLWLAVACAGATGIAAFVVTSDR